MKDRKTECPVCGERVCGFHLEPHLWRHLPYARGDLGGRRCWCGRRFAHCSWLWHVRDHGGGRVHYLACRLNLESKE